MIHQTIAAEAVPPTS